MGASLGWLEGDVVDVGLEPGGLFGTCVLYLSVISPYFNKP